MFLVLVAATLAACANEEELTTVPSDFAAGVPLTATLTAKSVDATRSVTAEGVTAWKKYEKIAVYYLTATGDHATAVATVTAVDADGNATIEASLNNPQMGESKVSLVYPSSLANSTGGIDTEKLISSQEGTIKDISVNWDAATATDVAMAVSPSTGTATLATTALTNQVCIYKFDLKLMDKGRVSDEQGATGFEITTTDGSDNTYTYTVAPASNVNTLYVAMLPLQAKSIKFTAIASTGYVYTKTFNDIELTSGKLYASELDLEFTYEAGTVTFPTQDVVQLAINEKSGYLILCKDKGPNSLAGLDSPIDWYTANGYNFTLGNKEYKFTIGSLSRWKNIMLLCGGGFGYKYINEKISKYNNDGWWTNMSGYYWTSDDHSNVIGGPLGQRPLGYYITPSSYNYMGKGSYNNVRLVAYYEDHE